MSDGMFIQDVDRHAPCKWRSNPSMKYGKECVSDSTSVWVFVGLAITIVGFSMLAGSVIVRVVDARARREANRRVEVGDDEEVDVEPYRDCPIENPPESRKVFDEEKQLLL